jgi:hypothetical protein
MAAESLAKARLHVINGALEEVTDQPVSQVM